LLTHSAISSAVSTAAAVARGEPVALDLSIPRPRSRIRLERATFSFASADSSPGTAGCPPRQYPSDRSPGMATPNSGLRVGADPTTSAPGGRPSQTRNSPKPGQRDLHYFGASSFSDKGSFVAHADAAQVLKLFDV